jgi:hypothetical protein
MSIRTRRSARRPYLHLNSPFLLFSNVQLSLFRNEHCKFSNIPSIFPLKTRWPRLTDYPTQSKLAEEESLPAHIPTQRALNLVQNKLYWHRLSQPKAVSVPDVTDADYSRKSSCQRGVVNPCILSLAPPIHTNYEPILLIKITFSLISNRAYPRPDSHKNSYGRFTRPQSRFNCQAYLRYL